MDNKQAIELCTRIFAQQKMPHYIKIGAVDVKKEVTTEEICDLALFAMKTLEENDKLKEENEQLKDLTRYGQEFKSNKKMGDLSKGEYLEFIRSMIWKSYEQDEEIKRLKQELFKLDKSDTSKEESSIEYYNLYRQQLDENKRLKQELEHSVKLPCKVGEIVYVIAECESIEQRLDGSLWGEDGGFGDATGYYCPYEDNCPHADLENDCEECKKISAVFEDCVNGFIFEEHNMFVTTEYCGLCGNIGEYIFLKKEQAENKLEELRGDK